MNAPANSNQPLGPHGPEPVGTCYDCGNLSELEAWELNGKTIHLCDDCLQVRRREEDPDPFGLEDYANQLMREEDAG